MKNVKEIEIKIEGETWENALDKAYKKKNKEVKVEGFRKGTAPKNIFIKKFGIESLYMDAVDFVMDEAYKKALDKAKITPVIEPKLDITSINEKEAIFKFTITAKPEVTLGEYKKLGIKKETVKVTKEEIDEEVSKLQNQLAEIAPKEKGKVEKGNTAVIDFEGFVDGKALEGGKGENYPLEIGTNTFIPGFEDGVIGMAIGETKELNLKFPEDYVADLKGKDVKFNVTVREIKERIVPELNEDFYKDLGYENIKNETEFRKEVENVIIERKTADIEDAHLEKCLEKASENMKVELSEDIISEEVHRMIHQFEDQLKMQGIKIDDYMQITGMTHEKLHEQMEPEATKRIKYRYLLEAIADVEKIDFTEEEVNKKAEEMASNYGITVEELLKAYGSNEIVKYDMKMHGALEIVKNNN
ncbi:MAG: trigger factor [Bacilli bacterium]|jgi:trigger factor|nr:trigger factor [Bacilli bacterium]